jgi:hypothetical protein
VTTTPASYVTDTYFSVMDWDAFTGDFAAHRDIQEWERKHGVDPKLVHGSGPIHRDEEHCRVVYVGRDDPAQLPNVWTTCVQQGETPPMPWPTELDRYRVPA